MKKHTKLYLDYFGYSVADFIGCEMCGSKAVDIHHINCRGMGGTSKQDEIGNIMALCRSCHVKFGDKKQFLDLLQSIHNQVIARK